MPPKFRIKQYSENSYYHVYNRGVEKRIIFLDEQDYYIFLRYLEDYLTQKDDAKLLNQLSNPLISYKERANILKLLRLNNFYGEVTILSYCLMPNHFHFLLKQKNANGMDRFMQSLCTRYTAYFNRKYRRVGALYQDTYKAIEVITEPQFIYLTKYIHKQALHASASQGDTLQSYDHPSSYADYLGKRKTEWVHPEEVLAYFAKANPAKDYQAFVEEKDLGPIENILLEDY